MNDIPTLSSGQSRQARALLAWSQRDLAQRASLAVSTVADFERGFRTPVPNNIEAMRAALEQAGVSFVAGGAIIGADTGSLAAARSGGMPVRFIEATDLAGEWSDRRYGAQEQMPTVITNLIRASAGLAAHLNFPAGDSVQHSGWDGVCEIGEGTEYIPAGKSIWEFGAQRVGITGKATEDYKKRSDEIAAIDRKDMTFVFVTPRRWREKAKWIKERRAERAWRDVVVYDADRLVHWLEIFPAVGHWLATSMGKRPRGVRQLQDLWDEWSLSTNPPMTADLMLVGRDEAAASIWRWLNGPPGVLAIRAESAEEALAFGYAAIQARPTDSKAAVLARSLFAAEPDQTRMLGDSLMSLFLFLEEPEPGLSISLARRGHHVYAAYGPGAVVDSGNSVSLARPPRYELQQELEAMQIERGRAMQLAQDAAQSTTVLRRLMPSAPGLPVPEWAKPEHAIGLIVALLAGAWDDSYEGDRSILEKLGKDGYPSIEARLTPWLGPLDSPLRKAGHVWKIASPRDAWFRLAPRYVTAEHLKAFRDVAVEVLSSPDPRYDLPGNERWRASMKGVRPVYSDMLKIGITETLGILAIFGKQAQAVSNAELIAEQVVRALLANADGRRWWSLSSRLEELAEACPDAFLDALQNSLDQNLPAVMEIFQEDEGGLTGRSYHIHLLCSLEILARSPRYLTRAARLLARLADLDPVPKSRHANRPARSLGQIFSLFFPQTTVSQTDRLRILNVLRKDEPKAIWRLLLGLLPSSHVAGDLGPLPRWRDFSEVETEEVTWPLISTGADTITEWLLEEAGNMPDRWEQLIEAFPRFSPERRAQMILLLKQPASGTMQEEDRARIWSRLRNLINHHRHFAKSDWALPESELEEVEGAYHVYQPQDPVVRVAWLFFRQDAELLRPAVYERETVSNNLQSNQLEADRLRRVAVEDLFGQFGHEVFFRLAHIGDVNSALIGLAIAEAGIDDDTKEKVLIRSLRSDAPQETGIALGIVLTACQTKDRQWSEALIRRAIADAWAPEEITRLLVMLPSERVLWESIRDFGTDVEALYWKKMSAGLDLKGPAGDFEYLATKLIENGRAHDAVRILLYGKEIVRTSLVAEALEAAAEQSSPTGSSNLQMFQYYVEELLQRLDQAGDIPEERLAIIEWRYLPLLVHSRRTALTLHKAMAQQPELFVMVVRALYKPDPESDFVEEVVKDNSRAQVIAERAYDLLKSWHVVPGSDGSNVDAGILEDWIEKTRLLCREIGRTRVGDHCIGQMLAHAPAAQDGIWPAVAVRSAIKITRSDELDLGVAQGLFNKRGPTWRDLAAGGDLERDLAAQFRSWAQSIELEWPRTSAILEQVARSYEGFGQSMDDDAARRNW